MRDNKVFFIGLSRTGTTSLHNILISLGLRSKHFPRQLLNNNWKIIDEYDALGDTPIPSMYKELDKMYPGSKFILTIRDKESWLSSMKWLFKHQ